MAVSRPKVLFLRRTGGTHARRFIDKRYRGIRIGMRVGASTQGQTEQRLRTEIRRIDLALDRRVAHARPLLRDCGARYLAQCRERRSLEAIRIHVRALLPYVGHLAPQCVHDSSLNSFIADRPGSGASATTINRSLEGVRTIFNRVAGQDPTAVPRKEKGLGSCDPSP
jgi:hypothetical protein